VDTLENIQHLCANCHEDKTIAERRGSKATLETKQKLSIAQQKRYADPAKRAQQKASMQTAEARRKLSLASKGKKHPADCLHCAAVRRRLSPQAKADSAVERARQALKMAELELQKCE
jgi:hypothetical protein